MDIPQVKRDLDDRMKKTIEVFSEKLKGIRTSTASPALVDGIKVDYYGAQSPLKQVATIMIPDPRQLMIKPFEQTMLSNIEKAIIASNIGLNPANDGKVIRLNIPPLSEERRNQLVDQVKKMGEETKVSLRNIRRDIVGKVDGMEKEKKISKDICFKEKDNIQKQIDANEKKIEALTQAKIKEIKE
ncbi:MAG: ribosome recycling factor [Planctomycetes bacterium]|nr:ribosome recycling factor [Planctomycetota bacterium]